jgi:glycosyltransferase involved in cell wall biosynthesis
MNLTLVSVIIPNYNHAKFLRQRIESVLNQTFQDFEIILLDDCSTDRSCDILEEYANHPKVSHFIKNTYNSGSPFKQWEKGISLSRGELVWIAESDDWCENNFLETLVPEMLNNSEIVLAYTQSHCVNENGEILWTSRHKKKCEIMSGEEFIERFMAKGNTVFNASMAVFRKSTTTHISKKYLNFQFCGDWLFWTELASQGKVFTVNKVMNYFRNHNADVSHKAYFRGIGFKEDLMVLRFFLETNIIDSPTYNNLTEEKFIEFLRMRRKMSNDVIKTVETIFGNRTVTPSIKTKLFFLDIKDKLRKIKQSITK